MADILRIATRQSPLALWQANYVRDRLLTIHGQCQIDIIPMLTKGDVILDTPLAKIGGKGLFVKELEVALLEKKADIAVHSIKDLPIEFPHLLGLVTVCEREDPRDAFVSKHYQTIEQLPQGSIVGTSSLRRQCQLRARRPDLMVRELRGNVATRLAKLDTGHYDAIILAAAGLKRLQLLERIKSYLSPEESLPPAGQGAIGIECRLDDHQTQALLTPLNDRQTMIQITAERAVNIRLNGGCQAPIASYATIKHDILWLRALVGTIDGSRIIVGERYGRFDQAEQIGIELAEELLAKGAKDMLQHSLSVTNN